MCDTRHCSLSSAIGYMNAQANGHPPGLGRSDAPVCRQESRAFGFALDSTTAGRTLAYMTSSATILPGIPRRAEKGDARAPSPKVRYPAACMTLDAI